MASKSMHRGLAAAITSLALVAVPVSLTGCFGGGGDDTNNNAAETTLKETSYELKLGAENELVNRALKFQITDVQRRPMSTFEGATITPLSSSTSSDHTVSAAATDSIIIQIDVKYTWNINTYTTAVTKAGGRSPRNPGSLKPLLEPGSLMYIEGLDADGNLYRSADLVEPDPQKQVNQLAVNSQWDYAVLSSPLPETSVEKTGSILLRVTSTAEDLKLVIYTPIGGQDITDKNAIAMGSIAKYVLPLT